MDPQMFGECILFFSAWSFNFLSHWFHFNFSFLSILLPTFNYDRQKSGLCVHWVIQLSQLSLPSLRSRQMSSNPWNYMDYGAETITCRMAAGQSPCARGHELRPRLNAGPCPWRRAPLRLLKWTFTFFHILHKSFGCSFHYLRRQLRSSDIATFVVPRTYTHLGDQAFPVAGPRLWNSLPSNLWQPDLTVQQSAVPPGVKDVFVWLTETAAPSDFCL